MYEYTFTVHTDISYTVTKNRRTKISSEKLILLSVQSADRIHTVFWVNTAALINLWNLVDSVSLSIIYVWSPKISPFNSVWQRGVMDQHVNINFVHLGVKIATSAAAVGRGDTLTPYTTILSCLTSLFYIQHCCVTLCSIQAWWLCCLVWRPFSISSPYVWRHCSISSTAMWRHCPRCSTAFCCYYAVWRLFQYSALMSDMTLCHYMTVIILYLAFRRDVTVSYPDMQASSVTSIFLHTALRCDVIVSHLDLMRAGWVTSLF